MDQERDTSTGGTPSGFSPISRKQAQQNLARRQEGYILHLTLTGGQARVRVPNLADRAFMQRLPRDVQEILARTLNQMNGQDTPEITALDAQGAVNKLLTLVADQERLVNEICVFGFMEPRLVMTPQEVIEDDPFSMWVGDIHYADRLAFTDLVLSGEREAAKRLQSFRGGSMVSVSPEPRYQAAPAAQPTPGDAGGGVPGDNMPGL